MQRDVVVTGAEAQARGSRGISLRGLDVILMEMGDVGTGTRTLPRTAVHRRALRRERPCERQEVFSGTHHPPADGASRARRHRRHDHGGLGAGKYRSRDGGLLARLARRTHTPVVGRGQTALRSGDRKAARTFDVLDHAEKDGVEGVLSVVGGKLTIFRLMAGKASEVACAKLGVDESCRTSSTEMPAER